MTASAADDRRWDAPERAAFLPNVRCFRDLPPSTLATVARRMRPRRLRRGEFAFVAGTRADAVNLLAAGRVKVVRETDDGREVILRMIQPGELFGGAGGWGAETYPASAIALEDAVVLRMRAGDFADTIARHPDFALAVVRELAARLRDAELRIQDLQTERVERRIARTLLRLANKTGVRTAAGIEIRLPLSRQDLAELTGATLSTVSRTLSGWDRDGLLISGRERVTIVKSHALVALAEDIPEPDDAPG